MSGVDIIYDIEHVTKKFPGVVALNDISLQVRRGEILAIVGENGAGKSTLMNILSGVYEKTEGKLVFDGTPMENMNPLKAKALGIAMVHQELSLSPALSIAENIYQGNLPVTKAHFVDRGRLYADAKRMLNMVGLTKLDPATLVRDINVSQQQQVEIAKALSLNGKFLILDEPTSSLTEGEADILLKNMKDLQQKGITILFISHKLDEVLKISNRVAVFRDGNLIDILDTAETGIDDMISLMVGRKYAGGFQRSRYLSVKDYQNIKPILEVENLNVGKKVFDASFKLYQGELLGITGLVGAGRSEILQAVFGADPKKSGIIKIHGKEVTITSPTQAIDEKMALLPEGRKAQSLFMKFSVMQNISIVYLKSMMNRFGLNIGGKEKNTAAEYIKELNIKTPGMDQKIVNLSGGNQQKVALAKWLVKKPDILMLDEPTQGIDVGAKNEIYHIIDQLVANGTSVIMVSSEMQENLILCDRIITLYEGHITGEFYHKDFTEEKIMAAMSGKKVETEPVFQ